MKQRRILASLHLALGFAAAALAACGDTPGRLPAEQAELSIYAATSLRDALQEVAAIYATEGSDALIFNFGSSGDLSRQIVAANHADLFFSADEQELDRVESAGLVEPGTRVSLLSNQLVVIEPKDGARSIFRAPFEPAQLTEAELVSLGNPDTVPAGKYAKAWLESCGVWERVAPRVLPGVDVRAALAAVESGHVRAGVVYRTDARHSSRVRIVYAVPLSDGPPISYPLAVLLGRPEPARARALAAFLASPRALSVFESHGFVVSNRTP